ncbi:uncharacterized protein BX664DRAFT_318953 [Halteromyces radiatus]|uniref:uncharacterized protein n=1 Tax=Halteromyces radiatus TaxID=101107 RepID=UPI00221EC07E|nr:uncharacterized protein BX664DRAFT_318953 [Halteromyces radiatus]KAI8098531.1 hypothetical protein BX664DRAFT_318953 [Halteromyces radiatus]
MNEKNADAIEVKCRNFLLEHNIIENHADIKKRENVLNLLRSLLSSFVRLTAKENGIKRDDFECQLLPFGSYGLGGYLKDADIDVVLLAPISIRRRNFSNHFSKLLKGHPSIREIEVIERTNVPIIKCVIDSISIDISFVRLRLATVSPDINLLDDSLLNGLEQTCLLSTDGPRVSQFILKHIYPNDLPTFRLALQCIKYWANQRYIYNKPIGYLNGGSWTLLLLQVYFTKRAQFDSSSPNMTMEFPPQQQRQSPFHYSSPPSSPTSILSSSSLSASSSSSQETSSIISPSRTVSFISLLESFFEIWSTWPWPAPVILTKSIPNVPGQPTTEISSITTMSEFKESLLPIVTPCYPVSSAAPCVTKSTLRILTRELQRANQIIHHPFHSLEDMLIKLFKPYNFIKEYRHFLKVTVSSDVMKSHEIWGRRMTHYLYRLVKLVEQAPEIKTVHPLTKVYNESVSYRTKYEEDLLRQGYTVYDTDTTLPLFPGILHMQYFLIGLEIDENYDLEDATIDLTNEIYMFGREVESKKNSKDSDVSVAVSAIKRRDLANLIQRCETI